MSELDALLAGVMASPLDDTPRLVLADYLDEHYPGTPVDLHDLPKGMHRWWSRSGNSARHADDRRYGRGSWSCWEIYDTIRNVHIEGSYVDWLDHGGSSAIGGRPVLVGEPYAELDDVLVVARHLQSCLGCPVGVARRAAWNSGCVRVIVWFDFQISGAGSVKS